MPALLGLSLVLGLACSTRGVVDPQAHKAGSNRATPKTVLDFRGEPVKGLARAERAGKWGFVDKQGYWVIQPTFDWAESFSSGLAAVKRGTSWGYVARTGKLQIAPAFLDAGRFSEGLAAVKKAEGWRFVNKAGKVRIPGPFTAARPFKCGQARVKRATAYFLGDQTYGSFKFEGATVVAMYNAREEALSEVTTDTDETPDEAAPPRISGEAAVPGASRVDHYALTSLFDQEAYAVTTEHMGTTRGLPAEPQWEEDVWLTIDPKGKVIPPAEVRRCGGAAAAPTKVLPPAKVLALIRGLHRRPDRSKVFRRMYALGYQAVPALLKALNDKKIMVRLNALQIIVRMGPQAAPAIPALTQLLRDRNKKVFFYAAWALGRMGHRAAKAVPNLVKAHGRDEGLVEAALQAIGPAAVSALVKLVQEASAAERKSSIQILKTMGPPAALAVPALRRALKERSLAAEAALALTWIGAKGAGLRAEIVSLLIVALKDKKAPRRAAAAKALGQLNPRAPTARTALIHAATKDRSSEVRLQAALPLVAEGSPAVVPVLKRLLDTKHQDRALVLLARLGTKAKAVAPEVIDLLTTPASRKSACGSFELAGKALVKLGAKPRVVLRHLEQELQSDGDDDADDDDDDEATRFASACDTQALKVIRSMGSAGVVGIRQLLAYRIAAPGAGAAVSFIIKGMGPPATTAMVALLKKPRQSRKMKTALLKTLGELGQDARGALPALKAMADTERNKALRRLAGKTKAAIEKAGSKKEGTP